MLPILAALAPILGLIVLGHQARSRHWVADAFWPGAERLTYYLFFPPLLFSSMANAKLDGLPVGRLALLHGGSLLALAGLVVLASPWLIRPWSRLDGPGFTSLFQCILRPNSYVALGVAAGVWGAEGIALIALCLAVVVPLVNLLCVLVMLRWARQDRFRWRAAVLPVVTNPLILSCLLGMAVNLSGLRLPAPVAGFLSILGSASLPLGLLAVGAGLSLGSIVSAGRPVMLSMVLKGLLLPLAVWQAGRLLGLEGAPLAISVAYAALPPAPASYVLARQMGGDAPLVATMLSAQTLAAAVILPLWIILTS
jgi:predicted permease